VEIYNNIQAAKTATPRIVTQDNPDVLLGIYLLGLHKSKNTCLYIVDQYEKIIYTQKIPINIDQVNFIERAIITKT